MGSARTDFNQVDRLYGLKMLIDDHVTRDSVIVEIGSFSGKSSELFALHCKQLMCVDVWQEYWELDGVTLSNAELVFDEMLKNYDNIHKLKMNSVAGSMEFDNESLDLVYIDAAHDYENTMNDIRSWFPKVKKGGIVAGHDYRYDPNIKVYEVVNEVFGQDYKIETYPDSSWTILYGKSRILHRCNNRYDYCWCFRNTYGN
jgi:predicted O-methyltransferase YrrM